MAWLLLAAAVLLGALLVRAPVWVLAGLLALAALTAAWLGALGGMDRALAPMVAVALALGLLVPAGTALGRHPRVAPAKRRKRAEGAPAPAQRSNTFEGVEVPGYELLEKVGSGGMASVFRARRVSDGTVVALKVPMEQYVADAKFIRRFHREAEVAQRLDHPNIVRTFEHGAQGVQHYMAMEYVDGRSLESLIEAGELDLELTVDVMKLVVAALQNIHSAGIIHRDIKPGNIMIVRGGLRKDERPRVAEDGVKLMDFGIAGGKVMSRLTMTGARVGTPVYMSPEQARGLKIDHRSDIYSLGLVLYEMLTGETAFKGGYEAIVHQQIFQTPAPPRQLDLSVPKALDQLVMRMIAKDADERPPLREVVEVLDQEAFDDTTDTDLPSRLVLTVAARQGVIRVMDPEGNLHATLGDVGTGEGHFPAAPLSVAVDGEGCFYAALFEYRVGVTDGEHHMIHKLAPDGAPITRFGRYGMGEGEFLYPASLAIGLGGDVYVLDGESYRIQRFTADGTPKGGFGGRGRGQGTFDDPRMLVAGPDGALYVLDFGNRQVQRLSADGAYQTRWAFRMGSDTKGMRVLDGVAVDGEANVYISDATAGRVRLVTPEGRVGQSFAIEPLHGEPTDGLLDLGLDDAGFLYAGRRGSHLVRKFDPEGRLVTTLDTYAPLAQMVVDVRRRDG